MFVCAGAEGEARAMQLAERMLAFYPSPMRIEG
jgi:hypothetical protein